MAKPFGDLRKGREKVRRRVYAKLLWRCLIHGDIGSMPFLVRKVFGRL